MTRMNRLAIVMISNFGRADGGRETWAYQFLPRLLQRHPHLHIDVCGLRIDGQDDNSDELRGAVRQSDRARLGITFLRAVQNKIPNSLDMIRAIRRSDWPNERPQLAIGVGSFVELLAMMIAPRLRGVPKAIWLRTIYIDEKAGRIPAALRPLARAIETAVLRRADLIIANGEDTAQYYRRRGITVEVIPNAVDLGRWTMPAALPRHPIKIAFIARLAAVKGIREFVELARRSARAGLPAEFHVIGEGPESSGVTAAAADGALYYHGALANEQVRAMLLNFDMCAALTFKSESGGTSGVSNALLEQMAAGRVILAWRSIIFTQVLSEDSAYFADQGNADRLMEALVEAIERPDEAGRRAMRAQRIAAQYSFDSHMNRFDALLDRYSRKTPAAPEPDKPTSR